MQQRFLEELAKLGVIEIAAINAGIERTYHYRWMADPEYVERYNAAQRESDARLEAEIRRRGVDGVRKGIWFNGKKVGEEIVYSDNLLMFQAKKRMPEYRDVSSTNIAMTANVQSNVKLDMTRVPQNDLEHLISTLELAGSVEAPGAIIASGVPGEDEAPEK